MNKFNKKNFFMEFYIKKKLHKKNLFCGFAYLNYFN